MQEIGPEIGGGCCFVRLKYIYALVLVLQLNTQAHFIYVCVPRYYFSRLFPNMDFVCHSIHHLHDIAISS